MHLPVQKANLSKFIRSDGLGSQPVGVILEIELERLPKIGHSLGFGIAFACHLNIKAARNVGIILEPCDVVQPSPHHSDRNFMSIGHKV